MNNGINAQLVAHRGYQRLYPENTLLAIREAISAGALHIEFDVQLSRDKIPVIYHDDTLRRISDRSGKVMEFDAEVLTQFSAHEPGRFARRYINEKISRLVDLVAVAKANPAVTFYVELKEESIAYFGSDTCLEKIGIALNPVLSQCVLISFDVASLTRAHQHGFTRLGPVLRNWATRNAVIDTLQACVMFINKNRVPAHESIEANCPVVVYEVDVAAEAKQLLQRGAAKVETFAIAEMISSISD